MLEHEGKQLSEMNLMEVSEYEKFLLNKLTVASRATVNYQVIEQMNFFLELVRQQKREIIEKERLGMDKPGYGKALDIGENEFKQPDDPE